jgi:hypothetical protein
MSAASPVLTYRETGADELRRVVRVMGLTNESAFDGLSAEQCIKLIRACWSSPWDVLPDELGHDERRYAALHGKLSRSTNRRLDALWGGK